MEGNEGILFGAIFPYVVMAGNKGIWFSTITEYYRCHFLIWTCCLPLFYLINPMCIVRMGDYSYIRSKILNHKSKNKKKMYKKHNFDIWILYKFLIE